jgi:hypothetical protein
MSFDKGFLSTHECRDVFAVTLEKPGLQVQVIQMTKSFMGDFVGVGGIQR